jgi:NADP-dependent 3-hydroxy acid dehydrogenase YdfG
MNDTNSDGRVAAAQRVQDELGGADVLVNNAGVMLLGPFTTDQRADYRQMVEVNLLGAITTTEVFLDQPRTAPPRTAATSSTSPQSPAALPAPATASTPPPSGGLNGWSESLRQELLPDVRVTLIEPGVVATELPNHITHAETKQGVDQLYSQAEVTAEDIADIVAFTLSRPRRLAINEILRRPAGQL